MDHFMGLFLLHDNYPPGWIFAGDCVELERAGDRCWNAIEKHGLFTPFYNFLPYWEQKAVTPPFAEFYPTFYVFRNEDIDNFKPTGLTMFRDMTPEQKKNYRKAVCIFYNHSDYAGTMRLKMNWQASDSPARRASRPKTPCIARAFAQEETKDDKGNKRFKPVFFPKPAEFARIEGDELVFPMTKWNYRMIVLETR